MRNGLDQYKPLIAVIGMGYVGLPIAVAFASKYRVIGFDVNEKRLDELRNGIDRTLEISADELEIAVARDHEPHGIIFTSDIDQIATAGFYVITVPTPVDANNTPDMSHVYEASETVGKVLRQGNIVVYESTVYPGATEEECVPILEKQSGLIFNQDFYVGYSPERINPGDKNYSVTKVLKVVSGSTDEATDKIATVYGSVITAGTHRAPSIKVAEAAKVIENAQRDINIAFVNELAKIFNRMDIDTADVLAAASTKWNFMNFKPGLVGGHCIGVDPYYLAQKAQQIGHHPEIILAGRRLNDQMGSYVAGEVVRLMQGKNIPVAGAKVLVLGFTFKENCPDVRNTRVIDIYKGLIADKIAVTIYDPWADPAAVLDEYGIVTIANEQRLAVEKFDAVILAVAHTQFTDLDIKALLKDTSVVYDVKGMLPRHLTDARL